MTPSPTTEVDRLLAEAVAHALSGWDFTPLAGRVISDPLPWDYARLAAAAVGRAERVLDIDTGGGELLATLGPPPGSVVLNRHGALDPAEIVRVLRPGGTLRTQQVGADYDAELNAAFGADPPIGGLRSAAEGSELLRAAGMDVIRADEARAATHFLDVGAVVLQLRAVSWQVPGFDVVRHRSQLLEIDRVIRADGAFTVTDHRLLFRAVRPS
ncbi:MAG TPA: hypothetical protein VIT41_15530 [Microlunatus sp.]